MPIYLNEIEPTAIAWLKELMAAGLIPDGHIDTRSIADVRAEDLDGFDQCHFIVPQLAATFITSFMESIGC